MKILYITRDFFSENDFPLLREFQRQGVDVDVYIIGGNRSAGIIEISKDEISYGVFKASKIKTLENSLGNYMDFKKIHFISFRNSNYSKIFNIIIVLKLFVQLYFRKYDIMHITWQFETIKERLLYKLPFKKIWVVHDPIPHSGQERDDYTRSFAFKYCKDYVLLSSMLVDEFINRYNIPLAKIHLNKMGEFDYLREMKPTERPIKGKYILFFGQIQPHKGVEILMEAMVTVHKSCPDLTLIVAGKGNIYFDIQPYENLNYIITKFRYIGVQEMVNLFRGAEFLVCPYKDATQSGVVQTSFSQDVPVLGTNVGALPKSIIDGVTGKIVPPSNIKALANAIIELNNHPEELIKMRDNIVKKWRPMMGWKKIAKDYIDIYESLE